MPDWSCAVTVNEKAAPAVAEADPTGLSTRLDGVELTVTDAVVESELAASDTVSVCGPAWPRVTWNEPRPFVSVESDGRTAPGDVSLLAK